MKKSFKSSGPGLSHLTFVLFAVQRRCFCSCFCSPFVCLVCLPRCYFVLSFYAIKPLFGAFGGLSSMILAFPGIVIFIFC